MKTLKQIILLLPTLVASAANAIDLEVVASLTDGSGPRNELVQGPDGNFYGTSYGGGGSGVGTIFRVSTNGALTTLVTFNGTNGAWPVAGLAFGNDGNLWGTCAGGVSGNLFCMTLAGNLAAWFPFYKAADGSYPKGAQPEGTLVMGNDGYLYGTTVWGGAYTYGTAFKVTGPGEITTFASFPLYPGPNEPYDGLTLGQDGKFYGTTMYGGIGDNGTAFQLSMTGTLVVLARFRGPDGSRPKASLTQGKDGCFYGTTTAGGSSGSGTVFRVTSDGVLTCMVSFTGPDGANPRAKLALVSDGNFYGTTSAGGNSGQGTVFRLAPDGTLTTLVSFSGLDGATPLGGLTVGSDGKFYGTTSAGGDFGKGVIYRLCVPLSATIDSFSCKKTLSGMELQFSGTPGHPYILQAATNLVPPVQWVPVVTNLPSANGNWQFVHTNTGGSYKFYRAVGW
jgi:uncharacterized repeat protein (TIGR03803 family)